MIEGKYFKITYQDKESTTEIVELIAQHTANYQHSSILECSLLASTEKRSKQSELMFFNDKAWKTKTQKIEETDLLLYVSFPSVTPKFLEIVKNIKEG